MTSRVRSRNFQYTSAASATTRASGGSWNSLSYSANSVLKSESMTDEISPGYFAAKRKGEHLLMNPMSKSSYKVITADAGTTEWKQWLDPAVYGTGYPNPYNACYRTGALAFAAYKQVSGQGTEIFPGFQSTAPSWPDSNAVLIKALANANAHGWDVGTFMAELGKTIGMISNFRDNAFLRANRITRSFEKKKRFSSTQEVLAAFSQTWLEGRYGWRTLAYDLEDINVALIKLDTMKHDYIRATESETSTKSHTIIPNSTYAFTGAEDGAHASFISRAAINIAQLAERKVRAGVMLQGIADGLAFVDPLVTSWEVVPFSFIVDWFTNIGDNVAAFSPFATGSLVHAFTSLEETITCTTICTPTPPSTAGVFLTSVTGPLAYQFVTKRATYVRSPANPSFSLTLRINLNPEKIVDLGSIFFLKYSKLLGGLTKLVRV